MTMLPDWLISQRFAARCIRKALERNGIKIRGIVPHKLGHLVVVDQGLEWNHNYADTVAADWVRDVPRFLARYRMVERKGELWREFEFVPFDVRMPMVNMAMEIAGEATSVSYATRG
jgi:homoaconitase/3-isopropylmalate dehydratase large subunit